MTCGRKLEPDEAGHHVRQHRAREAGVGVHVPVRSVRPTGPPMAQAYGIWLPLKLYSFCYWAFDQFCLNSRPVPLEIAGQMQVTGAQYFKPVAARAVESVIAAPVGAVAGGALNRFEANRGDCNG